MSKLSLQSMGASKLKWTSEEEVALRAGVEKYGSGKWRAIQKDPIFGPCLASRSNVDLKDKWRNMSVSANGWGSREKARLALKGSSSMPKQTDRQLALSVVTSGLTEAVVGAKPLKVLYPSLHRSKTKRPVSRALCLGTLGECLAELCLSFKLMRRGTAIMQRRLCSISREACGQWGYEICRATIILQESQVQHYAYIPFGGTTSIISMQSSSRLDNLIVEAISSLREPNGSSKSAIESYIEDHHSLPPNFRRLLSTKIKSLTSVGKLIKVRQNYMINDSTPQTDERTPKCSDSTRQVTESKRTLRLSRVSPNKAKAEISLNELRVDTDLAKLRMMKAKEAAKAAAQAVAEAEAAAAAAEQAANEAEAAEAEAEAAQAFMEAAIMALTNFNKFREVAVTS